MGEDGHERRKYGASFALCKWHFERRAIGEKKTIVDWFDGPTFTPWNNRDVLHNPSYSSIRKWIQLREWVTLDELQRVNDTARGKPVYKNLDIIRDSLSKEKRGGGDMRSNAWTSRNLSIKGLQDFMGRDEVFKTFEFITEYRDDRWISFAPKYGVILRDIPNPYIHGRIPVVQLKYYPIDEDIYGLSEIEPVEKLQKALNALVNQYLDAINMSLYTPIKVRTASVQLHTLEFGPGKKWLMNDPVTDVVPYETSAAGVSEFASTYRFMVGAMQEALGETSQGVSNIDPTQGDKTATEIRDLAMQRNARDNFNQLFLAEALKDQMMFWQLMNQQLMFDDQNKQRIVRIVGKDAIAFFENSGLSESGFTEDTINRITSPEMEEVMADPNFDMKSMMEPLFPVQTPEGAIPKMVMEEGGEVASVVVEPEDVAGNYDYIPDVRSMANPEPATTQALTQMMMLAKDPAAVQIRMMEGERLKLSELERDLFELLGLKNADKYYERSQNVQTQQPGVGPATPGQAATGVGETPSLPVGSEAVPRGA